MMAKKQYRCRVTVYTMNFQTLIFGSCIKTKKAFSLPKCTNTLDTIRYYTIYITYYNKHSEV